MNSKFSIASSPTNLSFCSIPTFKPAIFGIPTIELKIFLGPSSPENPDFIKPLPKSIIIDE